MKEIDDFRDLYKTEWEQNGATDNTEKDNVIRWQRKLIVILMICLIFDTLRMVQLAKDVKILTSKLEDPYYQGNASIGGGMNDDRSAGPRYTIDNGDIGDDPDVIDDPVSYNPGRFNIDFGNSKSETVEGSQYQLSKTPIPPIPDSSPRTDELSTPDTDDEVYAPQPAWWMMNN